MEDSGSGPTVCGHNNYSHTKLPLNEDTLLVTSPMVSRLEKNCNLLFWQGHLLSLYSFSLDSPIIVHHSLFTD